MKNNISIRLKRERIKAGVPTVAALAEMLEGSINSKRLYRINQGATPSVEEIIHLCQALGISSDSLLFDMPPNLAALGLERARIASEINDCVVRAMMKESAPKD